jgi:hypothetical protein
MVSGNSLQDIQNIEKHLFKNILSWVWWYVPVIPVLKGQRQKDLEFEDSLSYIVRLSSLKKKQKAPGAGGSCR